MKTKNPQNSCPWCIKHVTNPLGWRLETRFRVQHSSKNGANVHAACFTRNSSLSLSLCLSLRGSQQQSAQTLQNVASGNRQSRPRYKPSSARLPSKFWTLGSAPLEMKYSAISVYLISYDVTCTPIFCCSLNGPEHDNVRSDAFYTRPNFVDLRRSMILNSNLSSTYLRPRTRWRGCWCNQVHFPWLD